MKITIALLFFILSLNVSAQWECVFVPEQGMGLYDVHLTQDEQGIAVGKLGTILITKDGFKTSKRVETGSYSHLFCLGFFDERTAVAGGDPGTMLRTTDGGSTWSAVENTIRDTLYRIAILSSTSAVAVGSGGAILKTTDKGLHWSIEESNTKATLRSVVFRSVIGIASGTEGTLLRSNDAGETWKTVKIPTQLDLNTVCWANGKTLITAGDSSTFFRSVDSGQSWQFDQRIFERPDQWTPDEIYDVQFANDSIGYMCGWFGITGSFETLVYYGRIYQTVDTGHTWSRLIANNPNRFYDRTNNKAALGIWRRLAIKTADSVMVVGCKDKADNSTSFTSLIIAGGPNSPLFQVRLSSEIADSLGDVTALLKRFMNMNAFSSVHWKVTTPSGEILETTNAGKSWRSSIVPLGNYCYDMNFKGNFGLITGDSGRIFSTLDGGATWTLTKIDSAISINLSRPEISNVCILNSTTAFGTEYVGYGQKLIRTTNSGVTWEKVNVTKDSTTWISVPYFTDNRHGWMLQQPFTTDSLARQVHLKQGQLYFTSDSGTTWTDKTPYSIMDTNNSFWYQHISFSDPLHGWITGFISDSTTLQTRRPPLLFNTTDGGETWKRIIIDTKKLYGSDMSKVNLSSVDVIGIDSKNVALYFSYEYNNKIFRSTDAGQTWLEMTYNNQSPLFNGYRAFYRADSVTIFIVGNNSTLYRWDLAKNVLAVEEQEQQPELSEGISIYPNPTSTSFTISGMENVTSLSIMNSLGLQVSKQAVSIGKAVVDVVGLSSGLYFVQFRTNTGMVSKPIIVSH